MSEVLAHTMITGEARLVRRTKDEIRAHDTNAMLLMNRSSDRRVD